VQIGEVRIQLRGLYEPPYHSEPSLTLRVQVDEKTCSSTLEDW